MEEAGQTALEVAKEEDATPKAQRPQAEVEPGFPHGSPGLMCRGVELFHMGTWCNQAASRAPVTGMIANGSAEERRRLLP